MSPRHLILRTFPLIVAATLAACSSDHTGPATNSAELLNTQSGVPISPASAALTTSQKQQFKATPEDGGSVVWSVDGVTGGNATTGTITTSGLYVPPATAGSHTVAATSATDATKTGHVTVAVTDLSGLYTYHNDLARTGQNLKEYALTPTSVSTGGFGKRWSCPVDGAVYAQPLYLANLAVAGGIHNVLILATEHDSVYAIDADDPGCHAYWQKSFTTASFTPVPAADTGCGGIRTEIGITGTPVIDPVGQTLYVVAATKENGAYIQRLHALDITSGNEKTASPVTITGTVVNSTGVTVTFVPAMQLQRAALALVGGGVYVAWSSFCDFPPYYGWFMRYDSASLAQTAVFNVTPNAEEGSIWMSGGAPAMDSSGSLFVTTGNGTFDNTSSVLPPGYQDDFGESFLKLDPVTLIVKDFFTPSEAATWSSEDADISSSGVTVLPDGAGPAANPNVFVSGDKLGHFWMIDRTNMQQFHSAADPVVQYLTLPGCTPSNECVMGTPSYWNGTIYMAITGGRLMALPLVKGLVPVSTSALGTAAPASQSGEVYPYPGPTPMVSASPAGNGIVWALDNSAYGTSNSAQAPAILRAYDATNLGTTLYSSSVLAADAAAPAVKFTVPLIANGHVYVGGDGQVTVYGLAQ